MRNLSRMISILFLSLLAAHSLHLQTTDTTKARPHELIARKIISTGLGSCSAFTLLTELTTKIGARLSGSPQAERAVSWGKKKMEELGFDNVRTESLMVPHWVRGQEEAWIVKSTSNQSVPLSVCALGGSIATPENGITAEVLEVK